MSISNHLLTLFLTVLPLSAAAQNPVKGTYGYLYCHMSDKGEYTAYAVSRDGYHYEDILGGEAIFDPKEHARIEGGTRDAYITRAWNGKGYVMVTTDMCVAKSHKWDNYGIDLLKSDDLIHWTSVTFDYRQGPSIFCDGATAPQPYKDWSTINRVWAPQIFWDPAYVWSDGERGGYMIYYSMLNRPEEGYDRMYYSYATKDFTRITTPPSALRLGLCHHRRRHQPAGRRQISHAHQKRRWPPGHLYGYLRPSHLWLGRACGARLCELRGRQEV